jgi:hypothetical protein
MEAGDIFREMLARGLAIVLISAAIAGIGCGGKKPQDIPFTPIAPGTVPRSDGGYSPPIDNPGTGGVPGTGGTPQAPPPRSDAGAPDAATAAKDAPGAMEAAAVVDLGADKPAVPLPPRDPNNRWKPTVRMTWDWQLATPIDPTYDVQVYDIDLFENDASVIADLHQRGKKVICYVNMGAWEDWREDKDTFPKAAIGLPWPDFPHEYWLDVRRWDLLGPVLRARLDMAVAKGCDGVEPDNLDGWNLMAHQPTGFPLTAMDQLIYNRLIASEAHRRGLAVGLKNDVPQAPDLVDDFDFHVSEQCFEYNECANLAEFIKRGKPVFLAEYHLTLEQFCAKAKDMGFSAIRKRDAVLDRWRENCPN